MLSRDGVPVGINGIAGRIGGNALRAMIEHPTLKFCVMSGNDVALDPAQPARNFVQCKSFDSTFGPWPCAMSVGTDEETLLLDTETDRFPVRLYAFRNPAEIPWNRYGTVGVAECTGVFRSRATAERPGYDSHLHGGALRVALSAPANDSVHTVVCGVHTTPLRDVPVCSAASCTSGSIAFPLRGLLDRRDDWGFTAGAIQTVHAYTAGEQGLQDRPGRVEAGSRRMFAAAVNIIPTTTGAARAIPEVDGIGEAMRGIPFDGFALRVPVISGSVTLLQAVLKHEPRLDEVLDYFRSLARGPMAGRFAVNESPLDGGGGYPLVSSHIIKRTESSILDIEFCQQLGSLYTFSLWYGNEWGYVNRLIEALHEQTAGCESPCR